MANPALIVPAIQRHTGTVIMAHGLGDRCAANPPSSSPSLSSYLTYNVNARLTISIRKTAEQAGKLSSSEPDNLLSQFPTDTSVRFLWSSQGRPSRELAPQREV